MSIGETCGLTKAAIAEIERIRAANGGAVSPSDLVDAARGRPENPLHPYFEWDVDAAAERYLIVQARKILRSVKIVYQTSETMQMRVSAYVSVPDDRDKRSYYLAQEIAGTARASAVIRDIANIVEVLTRKVAALKEIMGEEDFDNLDHIVEKLARVAGNVRRSFCDGGMRPLQ